MLRILGNPGNKRATLLPLFLLLALGSVAGMSEVVDRNRDYHPCPMSTQQENRILHVATCDTRSGWKEFMALKWWNVTGEALRSDVHMLNVCRGKNWGSNGFLTKPLTYLAHIQTLLALPHPELRHIILMDSDTFWATTALSKVWNKYDCARGDKHLVVSTEMSCWVGRYCQPPDLARWYGNSSATPSYSPFVNSGVVMGRLGEAATMLQYVVDNNQSYYTTYVKRKFDDQYAIADYAISIAPHLVALDYSQQISASASIHAPGEPPDHGWPFVCLNRTGYFDMSCHPWTTLVRKQGHFDLKKDCTLHRHTHSKMALNIELRSLAPDPLIWHGNGTYSLLCTYRRLEGF
mmetsp:Transcript_24342/g.54177  ORF Transcript_24342/g.54177 Transcript_24342/m.54177 type:complete len:349 (+) Transcript_24342:146-1192(+)